MPLKQALIMIQTFSTHQILELFNSYFLQPTEDVR